MTTALLPEKLHVLCPEPQNYSDKGLKMMAAFTKLEAVPLSQDEFAMRSQNYQVLMVRIQRQITGKMIATSPTLKAIISPTTGLDHIDLEAAKSCNIPIFSLRGESEFLRDIHSSAEHTFALLLSLIRNIVQAAESVKHNRWEQTPYRGHELNGKTIGIIGFGRIGTKVAQYSSAFGMHVHAYDPFIKQFPSYVQCEKELDTLLKLSDILCICVPLEPNTINLIGARELNLLPIGAFLVNTARGGVLDENALVQNLEQGRLAGAALDVLTNEHLIPTDGHPLIEYAKNHSNLLITPHIAGMAVEAIEKTDLFVISKLESWTKRASR